MPDPTPATAQPLVVVIDNHSYPLNTVPPADSPLVIQARTNVLGTLKLDELVQGLRRSRGLLDLAYHGVASKGELRARVRRLQDRLMVLAGDAQTTMISLSVNSRSIVTNLKDVFRFLLMGKEEFAIKFLEKCGAFAHAMAEQAGKLADRFEALGNEASDTLGDVQREQGLREDEKRRIVAERAEAERKTKVTETTLKNLNETKSDLQEKYEEAKAAAEKAEGRAFAMAIVGAITKPIGEGLGTFAAIYAGKGIPPTLATGKGAPAPTPTASPAPDLGDPGASADELLALLRGARAPAPAGEEEDAAPVDDLLAVLAAPEPAARPADAADPFAALKALAAGRPVPQENPAHVRSSAPTDPNLVASIAAGAGEAAKRAGEEISSAGNDYARIAEAYNAEKVSYVKMLYDVRKQEREALAAIVDYAERMKNLKSQDDINRSVMDSLHQAVGALQRVVVILRQSQQFWRNMGVGFDNIAKSGLSDKIDAYRQIAGTDAERATLYLDPDFTREMIEYLAGWQALHLIAVDYADASQEVKDGIAVDYQKNLTPEEAAKAVPELAQMLIDLTTPAYEAAKTEEATVAKAVAPA